MGKGTEGYLSKVNGIWVVKWSDLHSFAQGTIWSETPIHPNQDVTQVFPDKTDSECEGLKVLFDFTNDNPYQFASYATIRTSTSEKRTILEDVTTILESYRYEFNDRKTRRGIVYALSNYFKIRMPKDKLTFVDDTSVEDIDRGGVKIMVQTPWVNAGINKDGYMLLDEFVTFATDLEQRKAYTKQFVGHTMNLSLIISDRLKQMGKDGAYIDELLGEGMGAKVRGGTSDLTMRQLAKLEVALDLVLIKPFTDKELGL
jgi:hypothetical protein